MSENLVPETSPIAEAIGILGEVVRECNVGEPAVKSVLRRCLHAALLVGDHTAQEHFSMEINGYPQGQEEVPQYRIVSGNIRWNSPHVRDFNPGIDIPAATKEREFGFVAARPIESRAGIDSLTELSTTGYMRPAPGLSTDTVRIQSGLGIGGRQQYSDRTVDPWEHYPAQRFSLIVSSIREDAYNWALTTMIRIKYENRISSLWESYRAEVDGKLAELNLTNHLEALDRQLGSSNEQEWRSALYSCRNMLRDVADYLWRDPNPTVQLPGRNGKMVDVAVDKAKYITRLNAYLFYKLGSTDEIRLTRTEAELLGELVGRVNTVDNNAHETTDKGLAESAALHTYMVIADLIRLTDMEPITDASAL